MPRCSMLPIVTQCAQAAHPPQIPISLAGGKHFSTLGTAFHDYMARWITMAEEGDVRDLAERHQVDLDELSMLCRWGLRTWKGMAKYFPEPEVEKAMASGVLTGTCDVYSRDSSRVLVGDWKTGFGDGDHEQQVKGYAWLGMQEHPDAIDAYAAVLRIRGRTRKCIGYLWTREQLDAWYAKLTEDLRDQTYVPGSHCRYCPRSLECPAKELLLRQAISAIIPPGLSEEEALNRTFGLLPKDPVGRGTTLAFLLSRLRVIATATNGFDDAIRADVAAHGGELPTADGRRLVMYEEIRHPLDSDKAIPIVEKFPEASNWRQACRLSKTELLKIIKAPRGHKKGAIARIMDALRAGDAITTEVITKLTLEKDDERRSGDTTSNDATE